MTNDKWKMNPALRFFPFPSERATNEQKSSGSAGIPACGLSGNDRLIEASRQGCLRSQRYSRRYDEKQSVCSLLCRDSISCGICLGVKFVKLRAIRAQAGAGADVAKPRSGLERFRKGENFQPS